MNVKDIIKSKGYTVAKIADEMGITRVTLAHSLANNPTLKTLQRIADILGCSVGEFFLDELNQNPQDLKCPCCGCHLSIKTEIISKN